jgi:hypothetical protein
MQLGIGSYHRPALELTPLDLSHLSLRHQEQVEQPYPVTKEYQGRALNSTALALVELELCRHLLATQVQELHQLAMILKVEKPGYQM